MFQFKSSLNMSSKFMLFTVIQNTKIQGPKVRFQSKEYGIKIGFLHGLTQSDF